ncbi:ribosome maturation factor RimM [Bifidobacterium sp. 82T24]|uniref:ribosome maturation factor RimM n=1 Tax=Bifidobacterium pluvialisilvae TaxID=2834436 RepID=UPI001C5A1BBC|nr:ribosome maturation factor RimM [Bifidobacterium pluvialisilvae]MBW3088986.1 ribosome maturation factor RimM [Bifidobacterium pluvialisilvae]
MADTQHDTDPQQRELLRVCRIGRAQGLKGEVNVRAFTDDPEERFAPGSVLLTGDGREFEVVKSRKFKERWILLFKGVTDRNASEALNGTMLYVEPTYADDDSDEDDGFYAEELIGLEARIYANGGADDDDAGDAGSHDDDSTDAYVIAGRVTDVTESPAQWLLTVTEPSGAESLVPFVEEIVPEVDLDEGYLVLDPPNGLLQDR